MKERFANFIASPWASPFLLMFVAVLAYGLLLPRMGFYWDDLPMSWIRYQFGSEAMARYFSTNRPVWGLLYQATTRLLPHIPLYWQIFALFWHWLTAVLVWAIVQELWTARPRLSLTVALLFLLYPGFNQQWGAYLYSHFFIVLSFFLLSLLLMLWSFRYPRRYGLFTLLAMLFSALNLWMMEYFFTLEIIRPFLIFFFMYENTLRGAKEMFRQRLPEVLKKWAPYLFVFLADVGWRAFVFNNQIYQPVLIPKLRAAPWTGSLELVRTVLTSLWTVSAQAWAQVFYFPAPEVHGLRITALYALVVIALFLLLGFYLFGGGRREQGRSAGRLLFLGLIGMFFAGWPFWLIDLPITLGHPANRFTLPFIFGVSLLAAGLLELLPPRGRAVLAALGLALAGGRQVLWADSFARDWAAQKTLFWQMSWRAPGLKPGTIVLLNEGALNYYADNSLGGALNWIYDAENRSDQIHFALFFPTNRLKGRSLPALEPGLPVAYDYIAVTFQGHTSQLVAFYYQPPGCLRVLDAEIDPWNHFIRDESLMREAARLSSSTWILPEGTARLPGVYGPEPPHGWCYYFEKADLARQQGDWEEVVRLGEIAFALDDYPNDPIERFVFIEGYAHVGNWGRAEELSAVSYRVSPRYVGPLLCRLWRRIESTTTPTPQQQAATARVLEQFHCSP